MFKIIFLQIWFHKRSDAEVQGTVKAHVYVVLLHSPICCDFCYPLNSQTHGCEILQLFQDVFSLLPIATIIDGKILIVHGGISDQTDLEFLSTIERHKASVFTGACRRAFLANKIRQFAVSATSFAALTC